MPPTPPGPLGDCLRDWEELQQDFQSIQVSANAGVHWLRAMPLWLGVIGRAAVWPRGTGVRSWGPWRRSRGRRGPGSRLDSPLGLMSVSDGGTLRTPLRPADPGPPARASERSRDPNLAFLRKNGRLSESRPGPVLGQSLSEQAVGAARPGPRVVRSRPWGSTSGPSAPGVQPGRQAGWAGAVVCR